MKTKNLLRAMVATLVAGAMGLAGVGSAMADTTRVSAENLAKQQTLTVTANEDISNRTLKAVPLAYYSFAQSDGTAITGFDLIDAGHATSIAKALNDANIDTKTKKDAAVGYDYNQSNPMVWVVQNLLDSDQSPYAGRLRDFLDKLKNDASVTGDKNATAFTAGVDNNHKTATVRPGVYAVVDTTETSQASIVMFNGTGIDGKNTLKKTDGTTYTLGEVSYKVHGTTVTKSITNVEDGATDEDFVDRTGEYKVGKAAIGKKVSFKMTSKVPNWTGYDKYYYAINDTYSKGLTFDAANANLQVTVGNETLNADKGYKIIATDRDATSGNGTFKILFAPTEEGSGTASDIVAMKDTFPVNATVTVTYSMIVNKDAQIDGTDTNTNKVEYSHNPNAVTDHETTLGDTVNVYVGKFTLTKTDTNKTPLAGAVFNITEDGKTDPVKFVKVNDNEYRVADKTDTDGSANITTTDQNNGVITLKGLYGAYTVKEISSPFNGSILPTFTLTVGITPSQDKNTSASSLTSFEGDSNKLVSENGNQGVTVVNARGIADMPKTGAVWLTIFGTMTVLLAGAAFLLLRRKA